MILPNEAERERAKQLKQQEKREQAAKMAEQSLKTVFKNYCDDSP
jgi:hypothetical protein